MYWVTSAGVCREVEITKQKMYVLPSSCSESGVNGCIVLVKIPRSGQLEKFLWHQRRISDWIHGNPLHIIAMVNFWRVCHFARKAFGVGESMHFLKNEKSLFPLFYLHTLPICLQPFSPIWYCLRRAETRGKCISSSCLTTLTVSLPIRGI